MSELPNEAKQAQILVRNAISRRRPAIVYGIARKIFTALSKMESSLGESMSEEADEWISIESLSQLRSVVGGRFKRLKERWVSAGFPVREHRGDRSGQAEINYEGWVELSEWISRQGFQVRLAEKDQKGLFAVRK